MGEQIGTPPAGYKSVNSYLTVLDVPRLIEFLKGTFDAVVTEQIKQPDGKIAHAEVRVGDSLVMVGAPLVDSLIRTQDRHRPGTFYVFVADVDATCRRAATKENTKPQTRRAGKKVREKTQDRE
jgi:PhnB protein